MPGEPLSEIVAAGDRRDSLEALRDVLALTIETAGARELAPLARQLALVLKEIAELPVVVEGGDFLERLAARDKDRQSGSAAS